ncbi:MAG: caspase family protein [Bacteroidota bacterium]
MKKYFVIVMCLIAHQIVAQQSGKSVPMQLNISQPYVRGLPPNLYVKLQFVDDNGNGLLEAEENARLIIDITNKGNGPAQGLQVGLKSNLYDPELKITLPRVIRRIEPNETKEVEVLITAGFNIKSNEHKMQIDITEHFGYDLDPANLIVNTFQYMPAKIVFSGMEIFDQGEGTAAKFTDGMLQAGEQIKAKIVVQNIGQNVALNATYSVRTSDDNIYVDNNSGVLGDMKVGETKEILVSISPNNRVKTVGNLPIFLSVTEAKTYGNLTNHQLPLALEKKVQKPQVLTVKADLDKIQKQVARIEYKSEKFSFNKSNIKNIESVPLSAIKRPNAIGIIIGIENYSEVPKAPYAANDADIIEKYFINSLGMNKNNVFKYSNEETKGLFFRKMFDPDNGILSRKVEKGTTEIFVYYSGHGVPDKNGDEVYLFPQDGQMDFLSEMGYSLNKFYDGLSKLQAKNVTVILDACFSGASRQSETITASNLTGTKALGIKVKQTSVRPWENDPSFRVLSSSSGDETSLGFDPSQSGLYTYFLCAGLQGEADGNKDRKITVEEMQEYLNKNVNELAKKMSGKSQTPVFYGAPGMILTEY